jgi:hypothetical protein
LRAACEEILTAFFKLADNAADVFLALILPEYGPRTASADETELRTAAAAAAATFPVPATPASVAERAGPAPTAVGESASRQLSAGDTGPVPVRRTHGGLLLAELESRTALRVAAGMDERPPSPDSDGGDASGSDASDDDLVTLGVGRRWSRFVLDFAPGGTGGVAVRWTPARCVAWCSFPCL